MMSQRINIIPVSLLIINKRIQTMDNEKWQRIQDHCNKITAEALAIQIAEFKTWEAHKEEPSDSLDELYRVVA